MIQNIWNRMLILTKKKFNLSRSNSILRCSQNYFQSECMKCMNYLCVHVKQAHTIQSCMSFVCIFCLSVCCVFVTHIDCGVELSMLNTLNCSTLLFTQMVLFISNRVHDSIIEIHYFVALLGTIFINLYLIFRLFLFFFLHICEVGLCVCEKNHTIRQWTTYSHWNRSKYHHSICTTSILQTIGAKGMRFLHNIVAIKNVIGQRLVLNCQLITLEHRKTINWIHSTWAKSVHCRQHLLSEIFQCHFIVAIHHVTVESNSSHCNGNIFWCGKQIAEIFLN